MNNSVAENLMEAIDMSNMVMKIGEPGCGKTSAMMKVALASSRPSVFLTSEHSDEATRHLLIALGLPYAPFDIAPAESHLLSVDTDNLLETLREPTLLIADSLSDWTVAGRLTTLNKVRREAWIHVHTAIVIVHKPMTRS